jgi:glycosyltransferase involved in cell wall biosynthesis
MPEKFAMPMPPITGLSMSSPVISIIVPVYKTEKYIARCLESLVNQTLQDIEIICVVSPAGDNSLAICKLFAEKDDRLIIIIQQPQGLSAARNEGLLYARGRYIQFCDSDDYCEPSMCAKLYNAAIVTDADIIVSGIKPVYKQSSICNDFYYHVPFQGLCTITNKVFKKTNVFVWNKLFKKMLIFIYNIKFPKNLNCEDACFFFKYLMIAKSIYYIDEPLYCYVQHPGSLIELSSIPNAPRAMDHVYILNDISLFMHTWGLEKNQKSIFAWIVVVFTFLACWYGGRNIYHKAFATSIAIIKNEKLVISILEYCYLFPWYIYKIFCLTYNHPLPKRNMLFFLKAYLFFPYHTLKICFMDS